MKSYVKVKGIKKFLNHQKFGGIDLTKFSRVPRGEYSILGAATQSFGSSWFMTPKGLALFKTYDNDDYIHIRDLRIINELVCMHVLQSLGIRCAEYEPANFVFEEVDEDYSDGRKRTIYYDGLVTYNVTGIGEQLMPACALFDGVNYDQFSLEEISDRLDNLADRGYKFDKDEVMASLFAGVVVDFITKQTDRNGTNINFIVDEQNNLRVAPMMDNEHSFYTLYMTQDLMYNAAYGKDKDEIDLKHFENMYRDHTSTCGMSIKTPSQNFTPNMARDIVSFAISSPQMMDILKHILGSIDISAAIKETESHGITIPAEYKDFMEHVVHSGVNELATLLHLANESSNA